MVVRELIIKMVINSCGKNFVRIVLMVLFFMVVLLNLVMILKIIMVLSKERIIGLIVFMMVVEVLLRMCRSLLSLRLMVVLIRVVVVLVLVCVSGIL